MNKSTRAARILSSWVTTVARHAPRSTLPVRTFSSKLPPMPEALPASAIEKMKVDAVGGDANAQYHVGLACFEGKHGFQKDVTTAFNWFKRSADNGIAAAQFKVGCMYLHGEGCPKDEGKAVEFFELAANQDIPEARFNLGKCYEQGVGVQQDHVKACQQYALSAAKENIEACYRLGLMHWNGTGVPQDKAIAADCFRLPAVKGNIAHAQFVLGYLFIQGDGVKQSAKEGERYLQMAAEQGLHAAQNYLGMILLKGFVVAKDYQKGINWLQKAAATGHTKSMFNLFEYFSAGKNLDKEALTWLKAAAEGGMAQAQHRYGLCLREGEFGEKKDIAKGEEWISKAAAQGFVPETAP